MKFTAHVATNKSGSECTTEFEIDDEALEGLTADQRETLLSKEAEEAIYDAGYVEIWWTEGDK